MHKKIIEIQFSKQEKIQLSSDFNMPVILKRKLNLNNSFNLQEKQMLGNT